MNLLLHLSTIISAVGLMFPAAAAEIDTNRTCNVTRVREDLFRYQLSSPSQCKMEWEDMNKTAYANELEFDATRVHNVSRDCILLKSCQDYMHFTDDCREAVEEVHCRVNCTLLSLLVIEDLPSSSVANRICFSESWCTDRWKVALGIGCPTVVLAIVFIVVYIRRRFQRRRGQHMETVAYSPANGEIKVQMQ